MARMIKSRKNMESKAGRNLSRDRMFVSRAEERSGYVRKTPGRYYRNRGRQKDRMLEFIMDPKRSR